MKVSDCSGGREVTGPRWSGPSGAILKPRPGPVKWWPARAPPFLQLASPAAKALPTLPSPRNESPKLTGVRGIRVGLAGFTAGGRRCRIGFGRGHAASGKPKAARVRYRIPSDSWGRAQPDCLESSQWKSVYRAGKTKAGVYDRPRCVYRTRSECIGKETPPGSVGERPTGCGSVCEFHEVNHSGWPPSIPSQRVACWCGVLDSNDCDEEWHVCILRIRLPSGVWGLVEVMEPGSAGTCAEHWVPSLLATEPALV